MSCDEVIDGTALARLRRLGGDRLVSRMIDLFAATGATRVQQALDAAGRGELSGVEQAAHSLRSSAGNVGARELQDLAGRVEERAAAGDVEAVDGLLRQLKAVHQQAVACLEWEKNGDRA